MAFFVIVRGFFKVRQRRSLYCARCGGRVDNGGRHFCAECRKANARRAR